MMSASGKAGWEDLFAPKIPGFVKLPYNDLDSVAAAIDNETVAVMLEPIQGEAGVIPASQAFVQGLRSLTREKDFLLIFDEVQTGMGRTGSLFAYQQLGVEPDIMTLGKGIGGGVPLSALLATDAASCFEFGEQGGTFNGNPLICAVGYAVLSTLLSPGFLDTVLARGFYLWQGLSDLGGVRGRGLLLALDTLQKDAKAISQKAFDNGLVVNAPRTNTLRFMPALNVTTGEIDLMLEILDKTLGLEDNIWHCRLVGQDAAKLDRPAKRYLSRNQLMKQHKIS
jgi:acetylornithine/N-succinyldiaminopimelate aminotransferase